MNRSQATNKRKDAKNLHMPPGINFASVYCNDGNVIPNGRIRASFSRGEYKSFSIKKYGENEAIRLAVEWRADKTKKQRENK